MKVRDVIRLVATVPGHGGDDLARVIIEPTSTGFSAYSPDLPGSVTTANSRSEVESRMREAISAHLEQLRAGGAAAPEPSSIATYVEVAA